MCSPFEQLIVLLESLEESPDFQFRITKRESNFVDISWNVLLELYDNLQRNEQLKEDCGANCPVKPEVLGNLGGKGFIDDEGIWHLLEVINNENYIIKTIATSLVQKHKLRLPIKLVEDSSEVDKNVCSHSEEKPHHIEQKDSENDSESNAEKTNSEVDSEVDYFDEIPSDGEEDSSNMKYGDFFGENDDVAKTNEEMFKENHSDMSDLEDEEEFNRESTEDEDLSNEMPNQRSFSGVDTKSVFDLKQERLKNKISKLEEEALKEKPWPLKGEVNSNQRPINSLLEEIVEIDLTQRPAPVLTKEVTMKLEDIIIKRIKDRSYDDVEKKMKPIEGLHEFKKAIVLDQEKSKFSLSQIYEQEYLKQKNKQSTDKKEENELSPEKENIKKLMMVLFKKLDTLSNFHFTPKPAVPELKIVYNLPAIMMEEVAPVLSTEGNLLAPEEISGESKRQLISKEERTSTDKKRERRKKKKLQASRAKRDNKFPKNSVKILKSRNTKILNESTNAADIKSSKTFFTKLQDDLDTNAKIKKRKQSIYSQTANVNIKKLKL